MSSATGCCAVISFGVIIIICVSSCSTNDNDVMHKRITSYVSSWGPVETDGESYDMLHELRQDLDDLKMEAIYVPNGELDESVRFELTYIGGRLTSLTNSSGVHYELTEKYQRTFRAGLAQAAKMLSIEMQR
jgi:hypothetical protein